MKALITGGFGFVGQHLAFELKNNDYQVFSTDRIGMGIKMDILDYDEIRFVLEKVRPDIIFHLAGIAYVPSSWKDPELVIKTNTIGSLYLFDAVRSVGIDPIIQIAGSSEEYGLVLPEECPIKETNPLRPLSPYAVSKIAMDMLGYQYFKTYGMKIIRTRAFNHEGYGRGEQYVTSTFCKQIAEIEKKLKPAIIYHGDLSSERDFTDVRDMVRAYRLAVEQGQPGEVYNIGSGIKHTVSEVLSIVKKLSKVKVMDEIDPKRMRPSDVKTLLCDSSKFKKLTGWKPKYKLEETLSECLRYWREQM